MTDCTWQYTRSRSPPQDHRPAHAAATPTALRLPPPRADGYKGKAGGPRKGSSPGAASRVTPERRTGRAAQRCLSWWVLPQESISSTLRLPDGAASNTDEWVPPWSAFDTVSPERGIFRPPPRSHLGETHANVACQCVGSATRCGHQLRVKPKVHEDGLRYNA